MHALIIILIVSITVFEFLIPYTFGKVLKAIQEKAFETQLIMFVCAVIVVRALYYLYDIVDKNIRPVFNNYVREAAVSRVIDAMKPVYDKVDIGNIVTKATKLPITMDFIVNSWFECFIPILIGAIIVFLYVLSIDITLAVVLFVAPLAYLYLSVFILPHNCTGVSTERDRVHNEFMSQVDDLLRNLCSIFTEDTKEVEMDRIRETNNKYMVLFKETVNCFMNTHFISFAMSILVLLVFMFRAKTLIKSGRLNLPIFATLALIVVFLIKKTLNSTTYVKNLTFHYGIIEASMEILKKRDGAGSGSGPRGDFVEGAPGVSFHNVTFTYKSNVVLKNYNKHFPSGEISYIRGSNGSGKTTILKLILNHNVPDSGVVTIDGISVVDVDVSKRIAYLPQAPMLFNRSVYENIIYGNENPPSAEEVSEFVSFIGLSGYIPAMDYVVEKSGGNLSGGQKQLVLFLRILCNPVKDIILLDEPTSALDANAKGIVMSILKKMRGKTIIMVTHDQDIGSITQALNTNSSSSSHSR